MRESSAAIIPGNASRKHAQVSSRHGAGIEIQIPNRIRESNALAKEE